MNAVAQKIIKIMKLIKGLTMAYKKDGAKKYIINICKNVRTLHLNETTCYHMSHLFEFESFDTEEQVYKKFNGNYKKCQICFKETS